MKDGVGRGGRGRGPERRRGSGRGSGPAGSTPERRGSSLYFAYGSNLDVAQMAARCPGARLVGRAWLGGHRLAFTGASRLWGGGVATVVPAAGFEVPGVLYAVGPREVQALDAFEGHPWFYRRSEFLVRSDRGASQAAVLYTLDAELHGFAAPSDPYVEVIGRGYEHHGFDPDVLVQAIALATSEGGEA